MPACRQKCRKLASVLQQEKDADAAWSSVMIEMNGSSGTFDPPIDAHASPGRMTSAPVHADVFDRGGRVVCGRVRGQTTSQLRSAGPSCNQTPEPATKPPEPQATLRAEMQVSISQATLCECGPAVALDGTTMTTKISQN